MNVQILIVATAIVSALSYVVWATTKTWFGSSPGCGSGCGKCATPVVDDSARRVSLL